MALLFTLPLNMLVPEKSLQELSFYVTPSFLALSFSAVLSCKRPKPVKEFFPTLSLHKVAKYSRMNPEHHGLT